MVDLENEDQYLEYYVINDLDYPKLGVGGFSFLKDKKSEPTIHKVLGNS